MDSFLSDSSFEGFVYDVRFKSVIFTFLHIIICTSFGRRPCMCIKTLEVSYMHKYMEWWCRQPGGKGHMTINWTGRVQYSQRVIDFFYRF